MEAPKCRLCGEKHWGDCPTLAAERVPRAARRPILSPVAPVVALAPDRLEAAPAVVAEPGKRGRPIKGEAHLSARRTKPWEAEGMSRATWYKRRAATRKEKGE